MMEAVRIEGAGGRECLKLASVPSPVLQAHQARVEVHAAGLNRADILQRKGFYPAPEGVAADIPGLEFAGTVAELGAEAAQSAAWRVGDRVMGIVAGGAMAREVCIDANQLLPVPERLSLTQAAALPEAFLTAFDALSQANAQAKDTVLIHAAPSGVGTAAVQLANLLGLSSVGTSRSANKLARLAPLGLDHALCVQNERFVESYRSLGVAAPNVIIDLVGGSYVAQDVELAAKRGHIIVVGLVAGRKTELDLGRLLSKRISITGTVLRSRSDDEKRTLCDAFRATMLPAFDAGQLEPVVDAVMPFSQIREAHARMEDNDTFGKIVLSWQDTP